MPVTVVVGGQFGSEGKGKVAHFLAQDRKAPIAVRVGGPNSGHTVLTKNKEPVIFRHLPTASLIPGVLSVIPPGSYLDVSTLLNEIALTRIDARFLAIDPHAWVIREDDTQRERASELSRTIGSTGTGTGAALVHRIQRETQGSFAKNIGALQPFIRDTADVLSQAVCRGERVIVEGTQGFGLSLLHGPFYPYCTSRDTTAAAFISEAGLSPIDVDEVVLVLRTFPIRVSGASGPLANEIDWSTLSAESGYGRQISELTSVTKKTRRVARFEPEIVKRAIAVDRPTCIVLNHLDYVDAGCAREHRLTQKALEFVHRTEASIEAPISLVGWGPDVLEWRNLRARKSSIP